MPCTTFVAFSFYFIDGKPKPKPKRNSYSSKNKKNIFLKNSKKLDKELILLCLQSSTWKNREITLFEVFAIKVSATS